MLLELNQAYANSIIHQNFSEHLYVRAKISWILNSTMSFLNRLHSTIFEDEIYRESLPPSWCIPSLFESVNGSERLEKEYEYLKVLLKNRVRAIIQLGSLNWGKNYWISNNSVKKSDLDIEVLIDEIIPSNFSDFPNAKNGLENFRHLYNIGAADYYSYGFDHNDIRVSIHFMPTNTFLKNTNIDLLAIDKAIINKEFRTEPKQKPPIYKERYDSFGKEYIYNSNPKEISGGILTNVPVMMVSDDQKIVMGLVMSKYFTYPKIIGDISFFENSIQTFKSNLAKRIDAEGGGLFSNMPGRKAKMPFHILSKLDIEQAFYSNTNIKENL